MIKDIDKIRDLDDESFAMWAAIRLGGDEVNAYVVLLNGDEEVTKYVPFSVVKKQNVYENSEVIVFPVFTKRCRVTNFAIASQNKKIIFEGKIHTSTDGWIDDGDNVQFDKGKLTIVF